MGDVHRRGKLLGRQHHLAVKLWSRKVLLPRPIHVNRGHPREFVRVSYIGGDVVRLNPIHAVLVMLAIDMIEPAIIRMTVVVRRTRGARREHIHRREIETLWEMK